MKQSRYPLIRGV